MKAWQRTICILLLLLLPGLPGCAEKTDAPAQTAAPSDTPFALTLSGEATPSPTPLFSPTPTVFEETPVPDALSVSDGRYTIAWLSDTQHYSAKFPDVYYEMTQFLYAERARLNLRYVVHTGDLVHNFDVPGQWLIADGAMKELGDIPYGVLPGNHDVDPKSGDCTQYAEYFGEKRLSDNAWYGESFQNNRCHFDLIEAGDTAYIFVYVGYPVTPEAISFANEAFAAYPQRVGFLCAHDYLERSGARSIQGETLFESVVRPNPNVYFVLCGHNYNALCLTALIDDGADKNRTVYQILNNYQAAGDEGGSGYLRFLQVDESRGIMQMYSYSPLMRDYVYSDEPGAQDEKYPFNPADETLLLPLPWLSRAG